MSSNINPYNIDGTFPIAGQDNSSQGFRDNFQNIKNNFIFAQSEMNDLQSKAIVTSSLNNQGLNNDMGGTQIKRPQLVGWTQGLLDQGTVPTGTTATFDFTQANFQKITTSSGAGAVTLNLINWPTSVGNGATGYGVMRIWISITSATHTIQLPSSVTVAVNDIAGYSNGQLTFDAPGDYVFDFSSVNGGTNFLIFDVTRNRASFRDPNFYYNSSVNPTLLIGYGPAWATALEFELGEDRISTLGSYNSTTFGNLGIATVNATAIDTGQMGGYTVTAGRGNVSSGVLQAVHSNDMLGYVNTLAYTGIGGVANTFQLTSSINFFATGSNVAYGLGGNIAMYTAKDGGAANMIQAVSINNDQSVKMFANAEVAGTFKTDGGLVEAGTYLAVLATTGGSFTANANVSTVIIDSTSSQTISTATITLPTTPVNGQKIKVVAAAPITTTTIVPQAGASVKWVASNKFASGNVTAQFTYMTSASTWYLS